MTLIELRNVNYWYPEHHALKDVTISIPENSVTALVGPNGAGKSTLLNLIAGLVQPFTGEVYVKGLNTRTERRAIYGFLGYLPDRYGLYSDLTVKEALEYCAFQRGLIGTAAEAAIARTIVDFSLSSLLDRSSLELSRGQRTLLAIAQSLIHQPELILLDEPAAGLDPENRLQLAALLRRYHDEGRTLIVSSHILSELDSYATWVLVVRDARVVRNCSLGDFSFQNEQLETVSRQITIDLINAPESPSDLVELLEQLRFGSPVIDRFQLRANWNASNEALAKALLELGQRGHLFYSAQLSSTKLQSIYLTSEEEVV